MLKKKRRGFLMPKRNLRERTLTSVKKAAILLLREVFFLQNLVVHFHSNKIES